MAVLSLAMLVIPGSLDLVDRQVHTWVDSLPLGGGGLMWNPPSNPRTGPGRTGLRKIFRTDIVLFLPSFLGWRRLGNLLGCSYQFLYEQKGL